MQTPPCTTEERARHWDLAYSRNGVRGVSWHQDAPAVSLELIEALGVRHDAAVIDIGGGASTLADHLVERGFVDISVLDVSAAALEEGRRRQGDGASASWLHEDLLAWRPERRFALWHDRAVLHFLVASSERELYLRTLRAAMPAEGYVIVASFAADGPEVCSGLPVRRSSVADLTELLGPEFELLETRREEHVTPRGAMQPFTWIAGRMRSGSSAVRSV